MTVPGGNDHYPGFDVVERADVWDEVTRGVVLRRLRPPRLRFFTGDEEATARVLVDRLLAQDDEPKVPVLELIDERLTIGDGDGFRYETMPEDGEAWRRTLAGLDDDARARGAPSFAALGRTASCALLEEIRTADGDWHGMPAKRVWNLWMRYTCAAYYSHPWAWNEIGFGGPMYPVGYANLGIGKREHWEVPEHDADDPVPWAERRDAALRRHRGEGFEGA